MNLICFLNLIHFSFFLRTCYRVWKRKGNIIHLAEILATKFCLMPATIFSDSLSHSSSQSHSQLRLWLHKN